VARNLNSFRWILHEGKNHFRCVGLGRIVMELSFSWRGCDVVNWDAFIRHDAQQILAYATVARTSSRRRIDTGRAGGEHALTNDFCPAGYCFYFVAHLAGSGLVPLSSSKSDQEVGIFLGTLLRVGTVDGTARLLNGDRSGL